MGELSHGLEHVLNAIDILGFLQPESKRAKWGKDTTQNRNLISRRNGAHHELYAKKQHPEVFLVDCHSYVGIGQEELVSCSSDYSTRWLAIK
jgi:hypothetical protein